MKRGAISLADVVESRLPEIRSLLNAGRTVIQISRELRDFSDATLRKYLSERYPSLYEQACANGRMRRKRA